MNGAPYEAVIGLEVHAQLVTRSKIFCSCPAVFGAEPNTQVCPVCLGLPGALPVLNGEAVTMAVRMGLATRCRIAERSVFARKNYFYPDCPKNYQISMYDRPLCEDGYVEFEHGGSAARIGIERIHLEDDAGKLIHGAGGASLVDFNRCGVPLIEIVTRPEIRSPGEAGDCLRMLRRILTYLEICDGNMEEGSLRCDVNVSIRPTGAETMGTKTEIKNLNSFKAVETGIRFEIERQKKVIEGGGAVTQVTNLWDTAKKRLVTMRSKEYAHDYRYFPEPDLLPLEIDEAWIEKLSASIPEMPLERERRLREEHGISGYESGVLCSEKGIADYYEGVVDGTGDPRASSNWIMREVLESLKAGKGRIEDFPVGPDMLSDLVKLIAAGVISGTAGREVFMEMVGTGERAESIVRRLGLMQISGAGELEAMIDRVIAENPREVERYRAGKKQLLKFFVGRVMKESGGKANPGLASDLIEKKLGD